MTFRVTGISWLGVGTVKYEETLSLFRDVLNLEVHIEVENQAILKVGNGQDVELFGRAGPGRTNNTPPAVGFEVDDFDAAVAALNEACVELVGEPGAWNTHRWQ